MKRLNFVVCAALAVLVLSTLTTLRASAAPQSTFFVTNTTDSGAGSLRRAINDANAAGGGYINFDIPGSGTHTIKPNSQLPTITNPVTIDGTTQPNCTNYPCIVLDGENAGYLQDGLVVTGGSTTIKGLVINRFSASGIALWTNGGNVITGNYIGTNVDGTVAHGNGSGVGIGGGSSNNTIGGTDAKTRNLISGNIGNGIVIQASSGAANDNVVEGDYIGTDVTGTKSLGNGADGVLIFADASDNTIGGTVDGAGNTIAHNGNNGVTVGLGNTDLAKHNAIQGNSIHENGKLGIDLADDGVTGNDTGDGDSGPNGLQNFPRITSADSTAHLIGGSLKSKSNKTYTIEFFYSHQCDGSGHGEGSHFLGRTQVTTDSSGKAPFTFMATGFSANDRINATATDSSGNTSEFSKCFKAT